MHGYMLPPYCPAKAGCRRPYEQSYIVITSPVRSGPSRTLTLHIQPTHVRQLQAKHREEWLMIALRSPDGLNEDNVPHGPPTLLFMRSSQLRFAGRQPRLFLRGSGWGQWQRLIRLETLQRHLLLPGAPEVLLPTAASLAINGEMTLWLGLTGSCFPSSSIAVSDAIPLGGTRRDLEWATLMNIFTRVSPDSMSR